MVSLGTPAYAAQPRTQTCTVYEVSNTFCAFPVAQVWFILYGDAGRMGTVLTCARFVLPCAIPFLRNRTSCSIIRVCNRGTDARNFLGWEDELLKLTQRVPTCVIWGDRDPYVSPTWAERFGAQTVHHLSEISHWPPVEAPQAVAQKLMAFFA